MHSFRHGFKYGYTLIELLVVLAAMSLLLAVAAPRYTDQVDRARETVLKRNLQGVREAIDKFYTDRARYPKDLPELVTERYLRALPVDPITDRFDSWKLLKPQGASEGVSDIRSGAVGAARDGTAYANW